MNIKLSIAIPIYNCATSIAENLEGILSQMKDREDIEIIVSDNASTDGSFEIVSQYAKDDFRIRVLKNSKNIGMDRNVFKVVNKACGEYIHIMSADDFYVTGSLDRIMQVIETHQELDVMILSNNYLNVFNKKIINNLGNKNDIYCTTGEELLEKDELKPLCLSNIIIKRSKLPDTHTLVQGVGILWPHLFILSEIINHHSKAFIFSYKNPLITVQFGNQGWVNKDAICTYYRAIKLYEKMIKNCGGKGGDSIKRFLQSVMSPSTQKSERFLTNVDMSVKFFDIYRKYYGNNFIVYWLIFSWKLVFSKRKKYFAAFGEK